MATATLSSIRVLRRPRRLDVRAVFGFFVLLVALGGSISFWSATSATTSVLVATHDLPAGATLTPGDVALARVRVDDAIYQAAIPASSLTSAVGKQLTDQVYAHQILARAQISARSRLARNQMAITIPVSSDTAVGGRIQPGDVVEVFVTLGKDTPAARSRVVLPDVAVYDVGHDPGITTLSTTSSSSGSLGQGGVSWLSLIVTQTQALQLAQAKWAGQLDVALLPGR
jgi:pilus assembly protein CpaB